MFTSKSRIELNQSYRTFLASQKFDLAKVIVAELVNLEKSKVEPQLAVDEEENNYFYRYSDIYISQRLIQDLILSEKFVIELVTAVTNGVPIKYPLKKEWISTIQKLGLTVSRRRSKFFFVWYLTVNSLKEIKRFFINHQLIFKIKICLDSNPGSHNWNFVIGMHPITISQQIEDGSLHTFKNWFHNFIGQKKGNYSLLFLEQVQIKLTDIWRVNLFFCLYVRFLKLILAKNSFRSPFSIFSITRTCQLLSLLLSNKIIASNKVSLYFEGGYGIVKEVWMNKSEKFNFETNILFTSSSLEPEKNGEGDRGALKKYDLATWDNLLVIDDAHEQRFFTRTDFSIHKISVVGPIFWADINYELLLRKNSIAIFDTEPQLNSYHLNRLFSYGYDDIEVNLTFLNDIFEVCSRLNIHIFHKSKRLLTHKRYPEYTKFLERSFNSIPNLVHIPEYVAASRLINNCDLGTIAYPCSTTAVIAKLFGKPSIYYDPTLSLNSFAEIDGVRIVHGKTQLREYLTNLIL